MLRHDPILIEVIQELRNKASADGSSIWLTETTATTYKIKKFDGIETIKEMSGDLDDKCISISPGDHLSQYNFENLEERLEKEKADREREILEIIGAAKMRAQEQEKKIAKPAKKTAKKTSKKSTLKNAW